MVLQYLTPDEPSRSISINWKAIVIGLLLTAGLAGGVYFWHDLQVKRNTPLVLAEAVRRQANGEEASALGYYETYLGYRPDDLSALAEHALLKAKLVKSGPAAAEAFYTLARAIRYIPDRQDLRQELVELGVRLNRVHDCQDDLAWLLEAAPDDPVVLRLAGQAAVQQRDFAAARVHYEKCIELDPGDRRTGLELFRILGGELKDFAAADALLTDLLARYKDDGMLQSIAAGYHFDRGRLDLCEANLNAALKQESSPKAALYHLQSEIARLRQRPRELEASLTRLADLADNDRRVELELADVELTLGRRTAAQARLLRIARDPQATAEHIWQCLVTLAEAGMTDDLPELRERLKERDAEGPFLISLAMRERMTAGDWNGALDLSRGLMKRFDTSARFAAQVSLWRADCFAQLDNVSDQLNSLQRAVSAEERNTKSRSRFARLLFQSGKVQEAQAQYAILLALSPRHAAEFVALLRDSLSPKSPFRLTRMEVDRLFDSWRESVPDAPLPVMCRMELLRQLSELDAARALIAEGLRRWPDEVGFHLAEVDRLGNAGEWTKALAQLDVADKSCGLKASLLMARIACLEVSAPDDAAARLEECAARYRQLERDGQAMVLPALVRGMRQAKVDPAVINSLTTNFTAENPHEPVVLLQSIRQFLDAGDQDAARGPLEELRSTMGEDEPLYQLAASMVDLQAARAGDAQAVARLKTALQKLDQLPQPPQETFLVLKAEAALLDKQPQAAVQYLQQALRTGRFQFLTLTRTLTLMAALGQLDQAAALTRELIAAGQKSPDENSLPQLTSAAALREALEPALDQSWPLALVAFRLDLQQEDQGRAAETLARAEALAPMQLVIAVNRLAFTDKYAPAELPEVVSTIERKLSVVDQARLLPPYLSRLKRGDDAEKLFDKAREEAPDDPGVFRAQVHWLRSRPRADVAKIEALLTQTLQSNSAEQAACRQVARLELARLWSTSRDYRVHREALKLAAEALKADAASDEARLLQMEVLAAHPGEWTAALNACRKLAESGRPEIQAEALFREVLIHERRQQWDEERRVLISLRELRPDDPQWLLHLMLNAVRRKDRDSLAELRAQLTALAPDEATELRADVIAAALADDRTEIIARVMEEHRSKKLSAVVADEWLTLLQADVERESLLKDAAKPDAPESLVRYAQFLGRQNRISEALEKARELWEGDYRELAAGIVTDLIAVTAITPEDVAELRELIVKEAEQEGAGIRMQLAAATVIDHAGDLAETQRRYRQILEKSPDSTIALNNSAYLAAISESKSGDDSIKNIKRAIEISGPIAQLLDTYGVLLLRRGDADTALEQLSAAWEQSHDPAHGTHVAWALIELSRLREAAQLYDEIDRADPQVRLHALERDRDAAYRAKAKAGAVNP